MAAPGVANCRVALQLSLIHIYKIVGGVVPKEYIPSIDKGIQEALNTGVLAGYPVEDVRVELIDGSYHDVDSSEAAFKVAGLSLIHI